MVAQAPKGKWPENQLSAPKYGLEPPGAHLCSIFGQVLASRSLCTFRLGASAFSLGVVLTVFHALELQSVGIAEEHGIVIVVVLTRRIDDRDTVFSRNFCKASTSLRLRNWKA